MRTRAQGSGRPWVACGRWDVDGGGRQCWVNKGMRRAGKGNEMGGVAWEGRPHRSTTMVRVRGQGRKASPQYNCGEGAWTGKEGLTTVQLW